uniref:PiggyBac transposable element-derived protein 3 n=1 Tax=Hirondellea gigas TaxID=1518452 RepID=A0A2P2I3U3_9CRUS
MSRLCWVRPYEPSSAMAHKLSSDASIRNLFEHSSGESSDEGEEWLDELLGDELVPHDAHIDGLVSHKNDPVPKIVDVSSGSDVEEMKPTVRHKKVWTSSIIVDSLDKTLDRNNYNKFTTPDTNETYQCVMEKASENEPSKLLTWTNQQPSVADSQSTENVLKIKGCMISDASKKADSPSKAWELFFSDEMFEEMVVYTNRKIEHTLSPLNLDECNSKNSARLKKTTNEEMKAFIGLQYARGLLSQTGHDAQSLWVDGIGNPIFSACMSSARFIFLNANITFDNSDSRPERFLRDRFAAIRDLFEKFNNNCSNVLQPDGFLAINETLYGCRNQVYKQDNTSKTAKCGLLFKSLNAARYPFTFRAVVYAGKPTGNSGLYYIPGILSIVKSLVTQLLVSVDLQGRNITMDSVYTSVELLEWLLAKNITAVGMIKTNKKGVHEAIKTTNGRECNSYKVFWEKEKGKMSIHSYVAKTKGTGMKNLLVLSTLPPILGTTKDDGKDKPALHKFYDFSKGGTDIVDERIGSYSVSTKSKRWTLAAFSYMLDTMRVNAQTIFSMNNGVHPQKTKSFEFGMEIVKSLITPHLITRKSLPGMRRSTISKINLFLNVPDVVVVQKSEPGQHYPINSDKPRRCSTCLDNIRGQGYTAKVQALARGIKQCTSCGNAVCKRHYEQICPNCSTS